MRFFSKNSQILIFSVLLRKTRVVPSASIFFQFSLTGLELPEMSSTQTGKPLHGHTKIIFMWFFQWFFEKFCIFSDFGGKIYTKSNKILFFFGSMCWKWILQYPLNYALGHLAHIRLVQNTVLRHVYIFWKNRGIWNHPQTITKMCTFLWFP